MRSDSCSVYAWRLRLGVAFLSHAFSDNADPSGSARSFLDTSFSPSIQCYLVSAPNRREAWPQKRRQRRLRRRSQQQRRQPRQPRRRLPRRSRTKERGALQPFPDARRRSRSRRIYWGSPLVRRRIFGRNSDYETLFQIGRPRVSTQGRPMFFSGSVLDVFLEMASFYESALLSQPEASG